MIRTQCLCNSVRIRFLGPVAVRNATNLIIGLRWLLLISADTSGTSLCAAGGFVSTGAGTMHSAGTYTGTVVLSINFAG
jgi:hypothetical protein